MAKLSEDIIGRSGLPPFFKVENSSEVGIDAPVNRKGDALRTWVRSLSGFQKEALVRSAKSGDTWRLVSDGMRHLARWRFCPVEWSPAL